MLDSIIVYRYLLRACGYAPFELRIGLNGNLLMGLSKLGLTITALYSIVYLIALGLIFFEKSSETAPNPVDENIAILEYQCLAAMNIICTISSLYTALMRHKQFLKLVAVVHRIDAALCRANLDVAHLHRTTFRVTTVMTLAISLLIATVLSVMITYLSSNEDGDAALQFSITGGIGYVLLEFGLFQYIFHVQLLRMRISVLNEMLSLVKCVERHCDSVSILFVD